MDIEKLTEAKNLLEKLILEGDQPGGESVQVSSVVINMIVSAFTANDMTFSEASAIIENNLQELQQMSFTNRADLDAIIPLVMQSKMAHSTITHKIKCVEDFLVSEN